MEEVSVEPYLTQILDIGHDTLCKLQEVFVDLGHSNENIADEYKLLVEETREFFTSKLRPKLELRGISQHYFM